MSQYLIPEQLDRSSPQPIYNQIYEQLKRELVLGNYKKGERFYSYRKLQGIYKTELRTIAAAVDLLIKEELIAKKATSGIYVGCKDKPTSVGNVWYAVVTEQEYHPFYYYTLQGVVDKAEQFGLRAVVRLGQSKEEFFNWFVPKPGEGLILAGNLDEELVEKAKSICNGNVITVGNYEFSSNVGNVVINCTEKIIQAFEIAVNNGCKKLALITGDDRFFISKTLKQCLDFIGEKYNAETICISNKAEDGYWAMSQLKGYNPDCVMVTEPAFLGVWEYIMENNKNSSEDLFIIRYGKEENDSILKNRANINLECSSFLFGQKAIEMLLKNSKETIHIDMTLKINKDNKENA